MANAVGDNQRGKGFLHSRLKNAIHNSNNIITGFSSNISSRFSMFSVGTSSNQTSSPTLPVNEEESEPELPLHRLPGTPESLPFALSEKKSPITVKEKIKETFKFENIRPALEDLMLSDESSEPSTLPTNTPESPKSGFHFKLSTINQTIPKKFGDYKALAMRTLSGEGSENVGEKAPAPCVNVKCVDQPGSAPPKHPPKLEDKIETRDVENASTCFSSRSLPSLQSLQANGPDPYDKFKFKHDITSSGSVSETGVGHSASLDSSDSDPHKKLWVRSGSQSSLQSWASSLSYDSQFEELNEVREFMKNFVEDMFKKSHTITVNRKAEFGKLAQTEQGRLWFARCINAKRGCKFVSEATFFSLIQHFAVMLFECSEADDFSPAKSLMNMCFTYYHEVTSPGGNNQRKEFVYLYLRQQPIWRSLRFWNAAFFDALQCERFMRPVATREQVDGAGINSQDAIQDELHYQENITFGQLGIIYVTTGFVIPNHFSNHHPYAEVKCNICILTCLDQMFKSSLRMYYGPLPAICTLLAFQKKWSMNF